MSAARVIAMVLVSAAIAGMACSHDPAGPVTEFGTLDVHLNMVGDRLDSDGGIVAVNDDRLRWVGVGETVTFSDLAVGAHTVRLAAVNVSCTIEGENPRSVSVTTNTVASVRF